MVFDKTGSLAGTKRHDYLPFGEDLFAGTGSRSTTQGYQTLPNPNDGVRQKFTQKERDNETGLDYFGSRYYSSTQGRFTSADAPFMDQYKSDPQSWNLYNFVRNNPLRLIDPTGNRAEDPCQDCPLTPAQIEEQDRLAANGELDTVTITTEFCGSCGNDGVWDDGTPNEGNEFPGTFRHDLWAGGWVRRSWSDGIWDAGKFLGMQDPTFFLAPGKGAASGLILNSTKAGVSSTGVINSARLFWGSFADYAKVVLNGTEYADVGGRLYTSHAIDRMTPRGLTTLGRSISPNAVEAVIQSGAQTTVVRDGVLRTIHRSGSVTVITEQQGQIVVTVITN